MVEAETHRAGAPAADPGAGVRESLDEDKLEVPARYEVHLDRKLERMLTMLVRLKDLRQAARLPPEAAR